MKIYLIGMPLSGKTTIGKLLAKNLNYSFIDTDQYIEEEYKLLIDDFLLNNKEKEFRKIETQALEDQISKDNIVISTGGGIVVKEENKGLMKGFVVFLDVDIEVLKERQEDNKQRPLLKSSTLEDLYKNRIDKYRKFADLTIKDLNEEIIICKIKRALDEKGYL